MLIKWKQKISNENENKLKPIPMNNFEFCFVDLPEPRPNEYGGKYGLGVIVRKYAPGATMSIRVELTASHMG